MSIWEGKVVVVTGGSSGFGKVLADVFASKGADVITIGRSQQRLLEAQRQSEFELTPIVGDVCDDQSIETAITQIIETKGRIDVWVNNVGASTRVTLEQCGLDEYQRMMDVNFFSAVRCTLAVLDSIRASSGSIVNIGSLAAKTAWPLMVPYCTSKHALAAFTHQVRLEAPANIHALFVCCGPIRRDDAGNRYNDESKNLPDAAKKPGGGVKLKGIDPVRLAEKILVAVKHRKKELVVPFYARILFAIQQLSPSLGDWLSRKFQSES